MIIVAYSTDTLHVPFKIVAVHLSILVRIHIVVKSIAVVIFPLDIF
jgi:hypothetical protein